MTVVSPASPRKRRTGFTLMELIVASFLISLLSMLSIMAWKTFGVPAVRVEQRTRIALSANLAAESLARDLSGCLLLKEARSETDLNQIERPYRFDSRLAADTDHPYPLRLHFKSGDDPPKEKTVSYWVDSSSSTGMLMRRDEQSGDPPVVVAAHVTALQVPPILEGETSFTIGFTVSYRDFEGTYAMTVKNPPTESESYPP